MTDNEARPPDRANLKAAILAINLTVMAFPPIYLWFADGSMPKALLYVFGSSVLLILSMVVLRAVDGVRSED